MIVQNVKLLVVIGIMKALSCHNGLMHIKIWCAVTNICFCRDFIISLTSLLIYYNNNNYYYSLEPVMLEGRFQWKAVNCTFLNG